MPVSDDLESALIERDVELLRVEAGIKRTATAALVQLETDIVADLRRGDPTSLQYDGGRQRRARSILGKTSRRIAQAFGIIRSDFKAAALQIIPLEAVNLREQVNETIGAQLMNRGLSNQAARALVADITVEGATVNEQFGRQAATTLNGVSDAVMASVRRGSHLGQLVAAIKGTAALNYQDGLFRAYDRQTRTLLLTAMANAVNSARHDVYKRHSELLEGLQAINPLDGSTATICKARAGRWWKNDGRPGPNTGEPFPGHPPWHFGCRTTLIPVLKSYSRMMRSRDLTQGQRKELQQLSLARQVALNGNPAKGQTFDQLLRSKSPKRRRELLGPGRAKMWADGDIGMTDLIDQSGRPMTILSLQQKAGIDTP